MEFLLLEMFRVAYSDFWPEDDDPRWLRIVHAGKFMIAWQRSKGWTQ
ncbi:MAG: hypothetical protein R3293_20830 [Candidatus Promineifilaceae bacterium]|nr:hypothetical protein [Candidatus Promineifilaceae bacterium]